MAQNDLIISNQSFPSFRTDLNNALLAIQTTHTGTTTPTNVQTGQLWIDNTNPVLVILKYYDGADNITLATINHTANTVDFTDSSVTITGLTTTATGTVLTLTDTHLNSTVSVRLPTGTGIHDDSGNEYVKFSKTASAVNEFTVANSATANAPELSTTGSDTNIDLKITPKGTGKIILDGIAFPNADGTASQVLQTNGSGVLSFATPSGGTNTPAFEAHRTTAQSLSPNTDTKVQWNTEDFDIGSCYDHTTNFRFTPNIAGKYVITHCLTVNNSSGVNVDALFVEIHKNGSTAYPSITRQGLNSVTTSNDFNEISFCVTKIFDMNGTTDFVEAFVHTAGSNLQTDASSNEVGFFSGFKLIE